MNVNKNNETKPFSSPGNKMNPFIVPEGYFESLPGNIMKTIEKQGPPKSWLVRFRQHYTGYAAAAVILAGLTLAGVLMFQNKTSKEVISYQNIAIDYFLNNGLDEAIITEYIVTNTTPALAQDVVMAESLLNSATQSENQLFETENELVEEYLLENGITESELLNL